MDIHTLRRYVAARDAISILETVDVTTCVRSVLHEFDHVIEAPNWTRDGRLSHLYICIGDRNCTTNRDWICRRLQQ